MPNFNKILENINLGNIYSAFQLSFSRRNNWREIRSSRPHGLCRVKRLSIVLREGAVRSLLIFRKKNSWGEIRSSRPHGLCRVKRLIIVLREGAVRSLLIFRKKKIAGERFELSTSRTLPSKTIKYRFTRGSRALFFIYFSQKNSWGEIRTLDLTGMSRALSPTELPSQKAKTIIIHSRKNYNSFFIFTIQLFL